MKVVCTEGEALIETVVVCTTGGAWTETMVVWTDGEAVTVARTVTGLGLTGTVYNEKLKSPPIEKFLDRER